MAKERDPKTLQILKAPSGDMMLVVPLDKATTRRLQDKAISVGIVTELPKGWEPSCPVIYGRFRFRKDFVIRPVPRRVRKVVKRRVGGR